MSQNKRTRSNSRGVDQIKKTIKKFSSDYYDSDISDSEPQKLKRVVKIWTVEEDEMLQRFHAQFKGNWTQVAQSIPDRNPSQCSQRWKRINPNRIKMRKQWTEEEDRQVLRLVQKYGKNWKRIENEMTGRSGKQIRERFINKLDKTINHDQFTQEEDERIYQLFNNLGPKWSEISKQLNGRPENMVKNRFYSHIKKIYNIQTKESDSDGKEAYTTSQENLDKNGFEVPRQQQEYRQNLETIQSQFDQEGSIPLGNQSLNAQVGLLQKDSYNLIDEYPLKSQPSDHKPLFGTDLALYLEVPLPLQEGFEENELQKKPSLFIRQASENNQEIIHDHLLTYDFNKMSLEQE